MRPLKQVLLVDGDELRASIRTFVLQSRWGCAVTRAATAEAMVEICRLAEFDVLIADLPLRDGKHRPLNLEECGAAIGHAREGRPEMRVLALYPQPWTPIENIDLFVKRDAPIRELLEMLKFGTWRMPGPRGGLVPRWCVPGGAPASVQEDRR